MSDAPQSIYPEHESALLPCPFCGEKRIYLNEPSEGYRHGSINCPTCLVIMPGEVRDRGELIGCWNAREPVLTGLQEDLILMSFHNEPAPQPLTVAQSSGYPENPELRQDDATERQFLAALIAREKGDDVNAIFFAIKAAETLALAKALGWKPDTSALPSTHSRTAED